MSTVRAGNGMQEMVAVGTAEELSVQTNVVTPAALSANATHAIVGVKTASVHVTFDGTNPADGGAGLRLSAGLEPMLWSRELLGAAKFIRGAGSNATVTIQGVAARM